MRREDHCDCPKFGVTCQKIIYTEEGVVVKMEWGCFTLEYFRAKDENCKNLKHTLAKGGVIDA